MFQKKNDKGYKDLPADPQGFSCRSSGACYIVNKFKLLVNASFAMNWKKN
jgi:hypothetical protein